MGPTPPCHFIGTDPTKAQRSPHYAGDTILHSETLSSRFCQLHLYFSKYFVQYKRSLSAIWMEESLLLGLTYNNLNPTNNPPEREEEG